MACTSQGGFPNCSNTASETVFAHSHCSHSVSSGSCDFNCSTVSQYGAPVSKRLIYSREDLCGDLAASTISDLDNYWRENLSSSGQQDMTMGVANGAMVSKVSPFDTSLRVSDPVRMHDLVSTLDMIPDTGEPDRLINSMGVRPFVTLKGTTLLQLQDVNRITLLASTAASTPSDSSHIELPPSISSPQYFQGQVLVPLKHSQGVSSLSRRPEDSSRLNQSVQHGMLATVLPRQHVPPSSSTPVLRQSLKSLPSDYCHDRVSDAADVWLNSPSSIVSCPPFSNVPNLCPSSVLPSLTSYPGPYHFEVTFERPAKETKSTTWTYSSKLDKMYLRPFEKCPIRFRSRQWPPMSTFIRVLAVYAKAEHLQEVVSRCPNHAGQKEYNTGHPAPTHLVRCEHPNVDYQSDSTSKRESLVFPHQQPQPGSEWVVNLFQFMCYGSCVGGVSRRPLIVIFTLEDALGQVFGRRCVEVRICACPGRDRKADEASFRETASDNDVKLLSYEPTTSLVEPSVGKASRSLICKGQKRRKGVLVAPYMRGDDFFSVQVRGRANYEILLRLATALEMESGLRPFPRSNSHANGASASSYDNNFPHSSVGTNDSFCNEEPVSVSSITSLPAKRRNVSLSNVNTFTCIPNTSGVDLNLKLDCDDLPLSAVHRDVLLASNPNLIYQS